jgi:hypothetical protein
MYRKAFIKLLALSTYYSHTAPLPTLMRYITLRLEAANSLLPQA